MALLQKYRGIIRTGTLAAIAVGPAGAFGPLDIVAVGGIWTTMFVAISNKAGQAPGEAFVKKFIASAATGAVAYYGGCKAATWLFHLIPGLGTIAAMGISALMNGIFTLKFGKVVADMFEEQRFSMEDAASTAAAVLVALCHFPSISDWHDLVDIHSA